MQTHNNFASLTHHAKLRPVWDTRDHSEVSHGTELSAAPVDGQGVRCQQEEGPPFCFVLFFYLLDIFK